MMTQDELKRLGSALLKLSFFLLLVWGMVLFEEHGNSQSAEPQPPLIRQAGRLIIPEGSSLRRVIRVEPVLNQKLSIPCVLPATVQALPKAWVPVYPYFTGRITAVNKQVGDSVRKGEDLVAMVSPDLAQAISDLQKAESAAALAQKTLARQQQLSATKICNRLRIMRGKRPAN